MMAPDRGNRTLAMNIYARTKTQGEVETDGDALEVVFARSGVAANWDPEAESLLDFAEDQGIMPDFGCRAGNCHSCMCRLLEGEVLYFAEPEDFHDADSILLCCAKPKTNLVIDI